MKTIDSLIAHTVEASQKAIAKIKINESKKVSFLNAVKEVYPSLEQTLAKQNLEIVELHTGATGSDDWSDRKSARVSLTLKPTSTKFKFIKFDGYTQSGSGRNQARLNARAHKLEDAIKSGTGIQSASANQFSFEYEAGEETAGKRLLVDLTINF